MIDPASMQTYAQLMGNQGYSTTKHSQVAGHAQREQLGRYVSKDGGRGKVGSSVRVSGGQR